METNQRLHVAQLSHDWSTNPRLNGSSASNGEHSSGTDEALLHPYLDAKIVGWNVRDKKIAGQPMTFIRKKDFNFEGGSTNFVPVYQQSTYKYLLYIEGHCAACRYGFMMQLGSVILKVESKCVADKMWYFPLLRPYFDHVPVAADLSNLQSQIEWCRAHDDECRIIAENARRLYDRYLCKDGIMDYIQVCRPGARAVTLL